MNLFSSFFEQYGPLLIRSAGLLLTLFTVPLAWLAWGRKIYPHFPLVIAFAVPCVATLGLLIDPRLLTFVVLADRRT